MARIFVRFDFLLLEKVLNKGACLKKEVSECNRLWQETKCAEMEPRGSSFMVELL